MKSRIAVPPLQAFDFTTMPVQTVAMLRDPNSSAELFPPAGAGPFHEFLKKLEPDIRPQQRDEGVGTGFGAAFEPKLCCPLRNVGTAGKVDCGF